jgi:hypothetical protein
MELQKNLSLNEEKPPHWHCPICWSEKYYEICGNPNKFCVNKHCPGHEWHPMLFCIPSICGSS